MLSISKAHFARAAADIAANGDNDTLPFDVDTRFIEAKQSELVDIAFDLAQELEELSKNEAKAYLNAVSIFTERLLVPTGTSGIRITTKIDPFWNLYFNGLGIAVAELLEPARSPRAHSYRYSSDPSGPLFDRTRLWRAYRESTLHDSLLDAPDAHAVQTDVSSFYEHVYHHRLENYVQDLFSPESNVPLQIDKLLNKFASGRSFGLPVGGQGARILAEVLMLGVDSALTDNGIVHHRYVDDFTLISESKEGAYKALAILSHILADYGLSLNRTKTTILKAKHYRDYVQNQLGDIADSGTNALREIDLYFDPYSDAARDEYIKLKSTVADINVKMILDVELQKAQPDSYLVAQVGRTLRFQSPEMAVQLCATLLNQSNLNAFRASWSTIMRGVSAVRSEPSFSEIYHDLDALLDDIPIRSSHLLQPESNILYYLKTLRHKKSNARGRFISATYQSTSSTTVRRACIECWHEWRDRNNFIKLRNVWQNLGAQEQRMFWLAARDFGDDGANARRQLKGSLQNAWSLGIEGANRQPFWRLYSDWAN